jgi:methylated-DNA-[protein]-cysteine S-methyltransferase
MSETIVFHSTAESPWGAIILLSDGESLTHLRLPHSRFPFVLDAGWQEQNNLPIFKQARKELSAYFSGKLRDFTVPFDLAGTEFQAKVWQALVKVPYGRTVAYSELAEKMGQPMAVRAVASANARNPLPIIVPCHRVIGKNGTLTGYSGGGVERKAALLKLEGLEF